MLVISEATLMTLIQLAIVKAALGWHVVAGLLCLAAAITLAGVSLSGAWELRDYDPPLPEGSSV